MPLQQFLTLAFKNQPFGFSINGNTVVIGGKITKDVRANPKVVSPVIENPPITVKGKIVNEKR